MCYGMKLRNWLIPDDLVGAIRSGIKITLAVARLTDLSATPDAAKRFIANTIAMHQPDRRGIARSHGLSGESMAN